MAATRGKWFKNRYTASYLGFLITMGLMGVWHGLEIHFIVYGLYHAALLIGFDYLQRRKAKIGRNEGGFFMSQVFPRLATFHAVCFGFLIFSGHLF